MTASSLQTAIGRRSLVLVLGGGDLGTGVAHRLTRCGFSVVVGELAQPTVVRQAVAFASAVYEGSVEVEGVRAAVATDRSAATLLLQQGAVPVMVDKVQSLASVFEPGVIVDARMTKQETAIGVPEGVIVIGLGPGFAAGSNAHAVVETQRGHHLGRVILRGAAQPNTGVPGAVQGHTRDRVLRSPAGGTLRTHAAIGESVSAGQRVAAVGHRPILAPVQGVLRGLAHDGLQVEKGQKIGDIDPRGVRDHCFTISDKARAVAGGVLEAILFLQLRLRVGD